MFSLNTRKYQAGFSMLGWCAIILVVIVFARLAIGVAPAWYENYMFQNVLKSIAQEPAVAEFTKRDIQSRINKGFSVNNIREIPMADVEFKRGKNRTLLMTLSYEVEANFFGNIYILNKYENQLNTAEPGKCCKAEKKPKKK